MEISNACFNGQPLAQGCQHILLKPAHFLVLVHAVGKCHFGFLILLS